MERGEVSTANRVQLQKSRYNSLLFLNFVISLGFCFAIVPVLPTNSPQTNSPQFQLTYAVTRSSLVVCSTIVALFLCWSIRRKDYLHQQQVVFWPTRCGHCARAFGLLSSPDHQYDVNVLDRSGFHHTNNKDVIWKLVGHEETYKTSYSRLISSNETGRCSLSMTSDSFHSNPENDNIPQVPTNNSKYFQCSDIESESAQMRDKSIPLPRGHMVSCNHPMYTIPQRSLLQAFYWFATITAVNIPVQTSGLLVCLLGSHDETVKFLFMVLIEMMCQIIFVAHLVLMILWFRTFYDAVFIDEARFTYLLGLFFSILIWVTSNNLLYPVVDDTGAETNLLDFHCFYINNGYGQFLNGHQLLLSPVFIEVTIVAAGLAWQVWSSVIPRSLLRVDSTPPILKWKEQPLSVSVRRAVSKLFEYIHVKLRRISAIYDGDDQETLFNRVTCKCNEPLRTLSYILLGIGGVYLVIGVCMETAINVTSHTKLCISWVVEAAFYLPLLGLYECQVYFTKSRSRFNLKRGFSLSLGIVGAHDRMLLLSSGGNFLLNIFRLVGGFGLLTSNKPLTGGDMFIARLAIFYALFRIAIVWFMTSFLLVVQRQRIRDAREASWTLMCLVYTFALNAAQWVVDASKLGHWADLQMLFNNAPGNMIGALIEPVSSMYSLHTALIVYEVYKSQLEQFKTNRIV